MAAVALSGAWYAASAADVTGAARVAADQVTVLTYDLGDTVFTPPNAPDSGPAELAAVVHVPANLPDGRHPLVLIEHGLAFTCADRQAEADKEAAEKAGDDEARARASQRLMAWPCTTSGPLPSYRGYDYLAADLVRDGFVVVSISANGINSNETQTDEKNNGYSARADLINKHLALWQELSATGGGDLSGKLVDATTGRPSDVDFRDHVDLTQVGTIGHSRGGMGVMWQASDKHRADLPAGVRVRAVLGLAPAYNIAGVSESDVLVTDIPFAVLGGTCDLTITDIWRQFVENARGRNKEPVYEFIVRGANHNFFNTQWSPQSGQVGGKDDFVRDAPNAPVAGRCGFDRGEKPTAADRSLTEAQQRTVANTYIPAFFRRHLLGDKTVDPILDGTDHPAADAAPVDVTKVPPVS